MLWHLTASAIDFGCKPGWQVRYIIDFYNAAPLPDGPVAMHLDARPALDSFSALADRLRLQATYLASGNWRRN
jgi:cytochrome c heme-lyase